MLTINDVFNNQSLNVFTDASIEGGVNGYIGAPGYVIVSGDTILESYCEIIADTTNNNSEIKAIKMGVFAALKYKNAFQTIRLFSDSQLCILGLRDRIFKWVNNVNEDNKLCGYNGEPIASQDVFLEIVNFIISNELPIQFYHQRGHINVLNQTDVSRAANTFKSVNGTAVDLELMKKLSYYNNMVDQMTRGKLAASNYALRDACTFNLVGRVDINRYHNLTHKI